MSDEEQHYLNKIRECNELVAKVKEQHPEFDVSDLFRIAMSQFDTIEEKLARGLRRRTFGNVRIKK